MKGKSFKERVLKLIDDLIFEKFSGEIVLRLSFNQGGVRNIKVIEENTRNI